MNTSALRAGSDPTRVGHRGHFWSLTSVVVPAHNAAGVLPESLDRLGRSPFGPPLEIIVVENGSTDDTWPVLQHLQTGWSHGCRLLCLRSDQGIGTAYRAGVAAARGRHVLLTADDLPFEHSDVEALLGRRGAPPLLGIGSKAHPDSRVPRGNARALATGVFRRARRVVLGLQVGDTQGTFFLDGDLARTLVPQTRIPGFGMTTELSLLAVRAGIVPVEVPVRLRAGESISRVRWVRDGGAVALDLVRLRHRLGGPGTSPPAAFQATSQQTTLQPATFQPATATAPGSASSHS